MRLFLFDREDGLRRADVTDLVFGLDDERVFAGLERQLVPVPFGCIYGLLGQRGGIDPTDVLCESRRLSGTRSFPFRE